MKKLLPIFALILFSCESPKPIDPQYQRTKDSIDVLLKCNECQIKKIEAGVKSSIAEKYCKTLYGVK